MQHEQTQQAQKGWHELNVAGVHVMMHFVEKGRPLFEVLLEYYQNME